MTLRLVKRFEFSESETSNGGTQTNTCRSIGRHSPPTLPSTITETA